jgi:poly [ADP-ribose] polymerase
MTKAWKEGAPGEPSFPAKFNVMRKAVLQVTDIKTNRNKYYAIELHDAQTKFRVYTHYGRTDDLEINPNAGVRESRYFGDFGSAEKEYNKIYKAKTSPRKGYKELSLVSANIGSKVTRGKVSGELDRDTLDKLEEKSKKGKKGRTKVAKQRLDMQVAKIVDYLYSEATNALTTTVNASITANGIETPLGVLTLGQIDKGQDILDEITDTFKKKSKKGKDDKLTELSGDFYTVIPHRFGRSKSAAMAAVIKSAAQINEKQDTLQLMRDMLNVNGDTNVLVSSEIDKKYDALNCSIETVSSAEFKEMKKYIRSGLSVKNIWKIRRKGEVEVFRKDIGNKKMLFHGSAVKHWVGILSRGLLLPKIVTTLGVSRTDGGWLGNGIYFGSEASTARYYASSGKRGTRFMTVAEVALGKVKEYRKITYGINKPPAGYNSCWGNPNPKNGWSEFDDNEWVIYDEKQQYLKYLVEFS